MNELTREQDSAIESLILDHGNAEVSMQRFQAPLGVLAFARFDDDHFVALNEDGLDCGRSASRWTVRALGEGRR